MFKHPFTIMNYTITMSDSFSALKLPPGIRDQSNLTGKFYGP